MRFCSGQPCAELAFFTRLRSARRTTHRERLFRFDFHRYTMHFLRANKMVNCDHRAIPSEVHNFYRKVDGGIKLRQHI
jgi:hypothetical protein